MWTLLGGAATAVLAGDKDVRPDWSAAAQVALSNAVDVVIRPKIGLETPVIDSIEGERCPNCGRFHDGNLSAVVRQESGVWTIGFLVAPDRVICPDQVFAPENVAGISVSLCGRTAEATVEKRYRTQAALLLKLSQPLSAAGAPGVDAQAGEPACAVTVTRQSRNARAFQAVPKPVASERVFAAGGEAWSLIGAPSVLLDAQNRICGYAFNGVRRTGEPADPARWPACSADEMARCVADAERLCARSVVPVTLLYRSPRRSRGGEDMISRRYMRGNSEGESETETELNTIGVLVSDRRLFVRIGESREKLVRLERIRVHLPQGAVDAAFVCALASYRGLMAELPQPRPECVLRVAPEPADGLSGSLAFLCRVEALGAGSLRVRTVPVRVREEKFGWRDFVTAELPIDESDNCFVFSSEGRCQWWGASVDMDVDSIGGGHNRWRGRSRETAFLPASALVGLASPSVRDIDPAARPASPEDEERQGWLGLDLQPLTPELAESKKIKADTGGGKFGALVTRVYAGSPAAAAGVKEGWTLLSLTPANRPVPMKVEIEDNESPYRSDFPWDRLDEVPAQYLERLPPPWPTSAGPLVDDLTRLGIGTKITATCIADSTKVEREMTIALSPPSFQSAPSFKWKAGGISVCDLTQEVRDYLSLAADAPGVVVCRVESGGKAVTAGVKPYEVITRFNGKPVFSAKEFETLANVAADIRLDVKRMTRERIVSFAVDAAK